MPIAQELLAEFNAQVPITRIFLERLPEGKLTWMPHPKSMTAGQLAYHLATVPGGVVQGAQRDQIAPPNFQFPQPKSLHHVLAALDESTTTVRRILPSFDDHTMNATWRIMDGDTELLAVPRKQFLRDVMLSHWYQHRGQFAVYLRLLDIPVPASFGPTADEAAPIARTE
jgi:uncharacterized damage-inducible protein DinB